MRTLGEAEVIPFTRGAVAVEHLSLRRPVEAHTHDFLELAIITGGSGDHHGESGLVPLSRGCVLLIPVGTWHAYDPLSHLSVTNIYFSKTFLASQLSWMQSLPQIGSHFDGAPSAVAPALVERLGAAEQRPLGAAVAAVEAAVEGSPLRLISAVFELLDAVPMVSRAARNEPTSMRIRASHDPMSARTIRGMRYRTSVARVVSLLHEQIDAAWSLRTLAEEARLSPSQLTRVFREDTGDAPLAYLQRIRAERLAYLLRTTGVTVAEAGRAVGWADPAYAARRFRSYWGTSPTQYRSGLQ